MNQPQPQPVHNHPISWMDWTGTIEDQFISGSNQFIDQFRLVFCCKICCSIINHIYVNNYYPDLVIITWVDGH